MKVHYNLYGGQMLPDMQMIMHILLWMYNMLVSYWSLAYI